MKAAGAYLWELRDGQRFSRSYVAQGIREQTGDGTNEVQVMRIEKGQRTKAAVLAAFVRIVNGNKDKLEELLLDTTANEQMGREAAQEWLKQFKTAPEVQDERRKEALDLIDDLLSDPHKLDQWLKHGRRLLEENGNQ